MGYRGLCFRSKTASSVLKGLCSPVGAHKSPPPFRGLPMDLKIRVKSCKKINAVVPNIAARLQVQMVVNARASRQGRLPGCRLVN